uniref:ORF Y n=1 Tax=Alewife hepatitis B virus TaxID=3066367 RepID=A0AA49X7T0_9HEPA|nr:ORF Y [Alewife hepatitis B virus]WLK26113.1 ORF Y [Alewife hepatitis B virus]
MLHHLILLRSGVLHRRSWRSYLATSTRILLDLILSFWHSSMTRFIQDLRDRPGATTQRYAFLLSFGGNITHYATGWLIQTTLTMEE